MSLKFLCGLFSKALLALAVSLGPSALMLAQAAAAGSNKPAVISGTSSGSVTEDVNLYRGRLLRVSRKLKVSDSDAGEAAFRYSKQKGQYGRLIMRKNGRWLYLVRNSHPDVQALGEGESLKERFKVSSIDGTTKTIRIRIKGTNDAERISGTSSGAVTEKSRGTGEIALSWIAPAEREDGTPISMAEIAEYRVYFGRSPGDYTDRVSINNASIMNAKLSGLAPGTYYIVVTAVDSDGRESAFLGEITRKI